MSGNDLDANVNKLGVMIASLVKENEIMRHALLSINMNPEVSIESAKEWVSDAIKKCEPLRELRK